MERIRVQIVEDNQSYALELEMMLTDLGYEVPPVLVSGDAVTDAHLDGVDLVLADIYYEGRPQGMKLAERLQPLGIPVILLTLQPDWELYRKYQGLHAAGFAVKPITIGNLKSLVERTLTANHHPVILNQVFARWQRKQMINRYIFVRHGGTMVRLKVNDISRIEADGNYCYLYEGEKRFVVKTPLRSLRELLETQGFIQISRGQLVNFEMLEAVDFKNATVVVNGGTLTIGKTFRRKVEQWLNAV